MTKRKGTKRQNSGRQYNAEILTKGVPDNSARGQLGPRQVVSEDKSARKRGLIGPYIKTTRTINNYCCLTYFFNKIDGNHKDTV